MRVDGEEFITVGQAAARAGVTRKAIRLYEQKGLLPSAERTEAGYRLFTGHDVAVLAFIRRAKTLGLTLSEIGDVLDLQRGGMQPCGRVVGLLDAHLAQLERAMTELRRLRSTLLAARRTAADALRAGEDAVVCRIIEQAAPDLVTTAASC